MSKRGSYPAAALLNRSCFIRLLCCVGYCYFATLIAMHHALERHEHAQVQVGSDQQSDSSTRVLHNSKNAKTWQLRPAATSFCLRWNDPFDIDQWWTHQPTWVEDPSSTNATHSCFTKLPDNSPRSTFLRNVYNAQWQGDCTKLKQVHLPSGGFTAGVSRLLYHYLVYMIKSNYTEPWTFTKKRDDANWLWTTKNTSHWAYCPKEDLSCYILPLTPCPLQYDDTKTNDNQSSAVMYREDHFENPTGYHEKKVWLFQYMMRYKKHVRQRVAQMMHDEYPPGPEGGKNCTIMHVRRGDAGLPRYPYRRYAAVSEYIEIGNVQPGDTIVLLTDDQSTIREVQTFHPQYNWLYANRPRNNGAHGGFDGHVPSHDPAYDFMSIICELRLARPCNKLVHGDSGFIKLLDWTRDYEDRLLETFHLKTRIAKEDLMKLGGGAARGDKMIDLIFGNASKINTY